MGRLETARPPQATADGTFTDVPRLAPAREVTATKTLARIAALRCLIVAVSGSVNKLDARSSVRVPGAWPRLPPTSWHATLFASASSLTW